MKRWLVLAFAAIAIAGFSTVSFAAIQNSHHDMGIFRNSPNADACYACHGIKETSTVSNALLGTVGNLCYLRCHASGGAAGAINLAAAKPEFGLFDNATRVLTQGAFNTTPLAKYTQGHKMVKASLPGPDAVTDLTATNWPYVADANMQCTTCHDVHSNTYAPFIRAPLSTGDPATSFCEYCHKASANGSARWVNIAAAPNGSHPSEFDYAGAATRTNNGRYGRTIVLKDSFTAADNNAVFRNLSPWGTVLNTPSRMYNPGGKLGVDYTTTATVTTGGRIGCYTCHAVHLPMTDITNTLDEGYIGQMIVASYKNTNGSTTMYESDLCVGCHGGTGAAGLADNNNITNPGVTSYYHPVDGDSRPMNIAVTSASIWRVSTGTFNIIVNLDNGGITAPLSSGRLLCASCHTKAGDTANTAGVHYGPTGSMLLNPRKPSCESCHDIGALQAGLTANSHHVYGGGTAAGTRYTNYGYTGVTFGAVSPVLTDGLQCNDCHVFNGTAHNWN